jgi:hypothetical protein
MTPFNQRGVSPSEFRKMADVRGFVPA